MVAEALRLLVVNTRPLGGGSGVTLTGIGLTRGERVTYTDWVALPGTVLTVVAVYAILLRAPEGVWGIITRRAGRQLFPVRRHPGIA